MTIHMFATGARSDVTAAAPARVVALSDRRAAIFFDLPQLPRSARITALSCGRPFDGPVATTRLGRQEGGERHVLIVARPAAEICASSVTMEAGGVPVARIDPLALQSPLVDPLALVAGLDAAGGRRLLRLILTTAASLFGKGDLGGFGMLVGQLVENLTSPVPLAAWCPVGRGAGALSWRLPADAVLPELRDLCVLSDGRARRFTDFTAVEESLGGDRLLHLLISRPLPEGADLIVLGEQPVRLGGPGTAPARPLQGWLERRGPAARAQVLGWLDGLAAGDARIAALRDEIAAAPGTEPRLDVLHLSETPSGLLYLIAVDDPRGLLAAVRLTTACESVEVPFETLAWHARHGAVVTGLALTAGRSGGSAIVLPVFRSGRTGPATEAVAVPFDGCIPEAFGGLPDAVAAPALAAAMPGAMRKRPVWRRRVTEFGAMPTAPRAALVIAAGEAPEFLHAALAALLAEPGGRRAEVVIHHADGAATGMVRRTAESLAAIHRVGIRVVSVAPQSFPSERLRAALAETRAPKALALAPGALPVAPGWLAAWRRRTVAGTDPHALVIPDGTDSSDTVALNAAAMARLVAARPLLPGVAADLAATPGLRSSAARGLAVARYESMAISPLLRAVERLVVARENGDA